MPCRSSFSSGTPDGARLTGEVYAKGQVQVKNKRLTTGAFPNPMPGRELGVGVEDSNREIPNLKSETSSKRQDSEAPNERVRPFVSLRSSVTSCRPLENPPRPPKWPGLTFVGQKSFQNVAEFGRIVSLCLAEARDLLAETLRFWRSGARGTSRDPGRRT